MWFDWDGELLRFAHTTKRQKYRNVQRNPRVAVSISDPDNPYRHLEVRGDVERIEPDKAASFFRRIAGRYSGDEPPPTPRRGARLPATPRTGWSSWCARPGSASISCARSSDDHTKHRPWPIGVFTWDPGSSFLGPRTAVTPEQAQDIERLGYRTLWVTGSPAAELSFAEPLLESTAALKVATGIVNIWTADAKTVAASFHRINTAHPGRFVLGIGAGHPEHTEHYRKPYDALVDYLDELDEYRVPATQRVLAALGPRVLRLAAERTAGAHPYLTGTLRYLDGQRLRGPSAQLRGKSTMSKLLDAVTPGPRGVGYRAFGKSRAGSRLLPLFPWPLVVRWKGVLPSGS